MKNRRTCIFPLLLLLMFAATTAHAQMSEEVSERFTRLLEEYMNTKDALVHDRDDLAGAWAERLETTIATTAPDIFEEGEERSLWEAFQGALMDGAGMIVDAEGLEGQREGLQTLTHELRDLIEEFGNPGEPLYVMQCDDYGDEAVIWINNSDQIANPYHGPDNQQCGEIIAEL